MTWGFLLLAVFLALGLRTRLAPRRAHLIGLVTVAVVLGYVFVGLGDLPSQLSPSIPDSSPASGSSSATQP